ncbi:ABC transporter ATP-binding protein [Variovorax sp. dw_954]|uniref:ABC transporter ATP-binding protein n=1 Tax=Variovorax sp. dw_954 TaxID=2720078 RepID=UPI001BD4890E|nr:ABC transporter ATP-binding protein [Variovorax sp. dw_954]
MHKKSKRLGKVALALGCLVAPAAWAQDASVATPADPAPATGPATATVQPSAPAAFPTLKDGAKWEFTFSPYSYHFHSDPEHKNVWLVGLARLREDGQIWGFAAFTNSFGQPSAYAYYGHIWENLFDQPKLYAKLTAGILYGYKGKYKDKVPYNHNGWSPGLIPSVGWRVTPNDAFELATLGTAGITFMYNRRF